MGENLTFDGRSFRDVLSENDLFSDYVSLVVNGQGAGVRVLNFPGVPGAQQTLESQVVQAVGGDPETTAVAFQVAHESSDPQNRHFTVIAATLPRTIVSGLRDAVEAAGMMPVSLTTAGIAAANLVRLHPEYTPSGEATGFLEMGMANSFLILFNESVPALARLFRFGAGRIIEVLQKNVGLDEATALNLYRSGSLDYSANTASVLEPWLHQISISLDFLERRYGRPVRILRFFGGGARSPVLVRILNEKLGCKVAPWEPMSDCGQWVEFAESPEDVDVFALAVSEALRVMMPALEHGKGGAPGRGAGAESPGGAAASTEKAGNES